MEAVIETTGLKKAFGNVLALDGLDLRVPSGSIFGCLGPNGAGKTTSIRILLGLLRPDAGQAVVLGEPVAMNDPRVRRIGAMIERPAFYPYLSARDNLRLIGAARGITAARSSELADGALERVGLSGAARRRAGGFSTGMLQRLGIASAILDGPSLLILDEPTTGLDPQGQIDVRELILGLAREEVTIFLSTHLLAEAEQLCTQLAVMNRGRVVAAGATSELFGTRQQLWVRFASAADRETGLVTLSDARIAAAAEGASACVLEGESDGARIIHLLADAGLYPAEVAIRQPSLEQLYVEITGGSP
jgi:ABC-2 type transport system ATP-binding protein